MCLTLPAAQFVTDCSGKIKHPCLVHSLPGADGTPGTLTISDEDYFVWRHNADSWTLERFVNGESVAYEVESWGVGQVRCQCRDWQYRGWGRRNCKHLGSVKLVALAMEQRGAA